MQQSESLHLLTDSRFFKTILGAAVAEWFSSWLAEQEGPGFDSPPRLVTDCNPNDLDI